LRYGKSSAIIDATESVAEEIVMTAGYRLAPIEAPYDENAAAWLQKWMPTGVDAEPLALFRLLALHPEMADRCRPMASGLLNKGLLPARDREVVIARITARAGAEYEWGVHATVFGPLVGLDQTVLDALAAEPPGTTAFDGRVALLVAACDELHDDATIATATWRSMRELYDDAQLVELLLLAGWYRTLSTVITSTALPLEPWAARFPASGAVWSQAKASVRAGRENPIGGRHEPAGPHAGA
jgi:alkylhydroperoxidase family enzyme